MMNEYTQLEQWLKGHRKTLSDAAEVIMDQNISSYPVFVAFRQEVEIGIPLIALGNSEADWGIQASTLEELTARGVMQMEKVNAFREVYKDPKKFLCILVLSNPGAEFVFFPKK
ncbi:MAG: hypothetical protein HUU01_08990 [Saprospiraceae bacterium]|nr:hypothetical protein [Saprospiraceae bacterium]